jgi:hypothetical protein
LKKGQDYQVIEPLFMRNPDKSLPPLKRFYIPAMWQYIIQLSRMHLANQ